MDRKPIIEDGYTQKAYIAPAMGFPAIRFSYRPTSRHQLNGYFDKIEGKSRVQIGAIEAQEIANKLVDWNLTDDSGNLWPHNPGNLLKLWTPLYNRIASIVLHGSESDPDPDAKSQDTEIQKIIESAGGLEGDRKN